MPRARPTPRNEQDNRLGPWRRLAGFFVWLGRPETLDPTPGTPRPGGSPGVDAFRWLTARETLPEPPPDASGQAGPSFFRWLAIPETLPEQAPSEAESSALAWLFRSEPLPSAPPTRGDAS